MSSQAQQRHDPERLNPKDDPILFYLLPAVVTGFMLSVAFILKVYHVEIERLLRKLLS